MKKNSILKILNVVLAVLLVTQITSGLTAMSLPHIVFQVVHKGGAFVLLTCALLHIVLNWSWIRASYFKKHPASAH